MRARPTVYKGIKMRSRLEARYAAFLDGYGIHWEYEPDCFADETGQYLPDFRITVDVNGKPHHRYIEIKPYITPEIVATAAPMMERIWSTDRSANLWILAPSEEHGFSWPHRAWFYKGDWYIDDSMEPCWSGGRW